MRKAISTPFQFSEFYLKIFLIGLLVLGAMLFADETSEDAVDLVARGQNAAFTESRTYSFRLGVNF